MSDLGRPLASRFELGRGSDGTNLPAMEGLRGIAVTLVFFVHFADAVEARIPAGELWARLLLALGMIGHSGVDLFFVLSGYLIYGSLIQKDRPFVPYLARRLQRIYPTFLVVFALYVALALLMPHLGKLPDSGMQRLLYVGANLLLLPGMLPIQPLVTVAWSLSYELFYYLVTPAVIALAGLRSWQPWRRIVLMVAVMAVYGTWCAFFGGHVRLLMFVVGILLFELRLLRVQVRVPAPLVVILLVAACAAMLTRDPGAMGYALRTLSLAIAFGVLCYVCFQDQRYVIPRWLGKAPIRWMGNMSYSYYLIHGFCIGAVFFVIRPLLPAEMSLLLTAALAIGTFGVTIVVSAALFVLIERPLSLDPALRSGQASRLLAESRR